MFRKIVLISFMASSGALHATQDVTEPKDVLPLLRSFLSHPTVSTDINTLVQKGCVWSSESIWVGGGVQTNKKNQKEFGGGFTILLTTQAGKHRQLRYFFSVIDEGGIYTVSSVRYNNMPKIQPEC